MKWKREKEKIKELSFTTCQKLHLGNSLSFKVVKENRTFLLEEASLCERKVLPATAGGQRKRNFQFVGGDLKSIVLLLLLLLGRQIGRWRSGPKKQFRCSVFLWGKEKLVQFCVFFGGKPNRPFPSFSSFRVSGLDEREEDQFLLGPWGRGGANKGFVAQNPFYSIYPLSSPPLHKMEKAGNAAQKSLRLERDFPMLRFQARCTRNRINSKCIKLFKYCLPFSGTRSKSCCRCRGCVGAVGCQSLLSRKRKGREGPRHQHYRIIRIFHLTASGGKSQFPSPPPPSFPSPCWLA